MVGTPQPYTAAHINHHAATWPSIWQALKANWITCKGSNPARDARPPCCTPNAKGPRNRAMKKHLECILKTSFKDMPSMVHTRDQPSGYLVHAVQRHTQDTTNNP